MKIIKANDYKDWKSEIQCSHCDAILEIVESDIKYSYYESHYYGTSEWFSVNCENCKSSIYLNKDTIPGLILIRLRGKK